MNRYSTTAAALAAAILMAACGGGSSPTQPSTTPSGGSTAAISGTVRSGSPLLASSTGSAMSGLVVSVVGTAITSGVDAAGRFMLTGVPPGDVQLKFVAPGVDATIPVTQLQANQTVSLTVNVDAGAVTVETLVRSTSSDEQLEGRIESLPPTTEAGVLKVAGRTVRTSDATRIEQGGSTKAFADLQIGMRVHVTGTPSGADVLATAIRIQNTNTWIPVTVNGVVDSFSGTETLFQFKVGSRFLKGDSLTVFFGGSTFPMLKDEARVEVKGQQRDGYIYAERIHVNASDDEDGEDDDDDGGQNESASIHGTLTAIQGTRPALTLTVGGTTVRTSAATEVQRRGDVQSLEALALNQRLHVVGDRRSDGSLDARRIFIEDDATGGLVEIQGAAGGVKGTCPALQFTVMGYNVVTSATTSFEGGSCTQLRSGTQVVVKGTRQADGTIAATSVKR